MITYWYRYEDRRYASAYGDGPGEVRVVLQEFRVRKVTPKGVRLDNDRFVATAARKRFACPTKAEAMESFLARKKRQRAILSAQLRNVEKALKLAEAEALTTL